MFRPCRDVSWVGPVLGGEKVACSRTQDGDPVRLNKRTSDPSIKSSTLPLSHCAPLRIRKSRGRSIQLFRVMVGGFIRPNGLKRVASISD